MASDARALLDQLMGSQRDSAVVAADGSSGRQRRSCYDSAVCPYYCVWGVDVYDLFTNTKSSLGANPRICDDDARKDWLSLSSEEQRLVHKGERELLSFLTTLVNRSDGIIRMNKQKVQREAHDFEVAFQSRIQQMNLIPLADSCKRYEELHQSLVDMMPTIDSSNINQVMANLSEMEELKSHVIPMKDAIFNVKASELVDKVVCEVSGNYMCARDADDRIAAHFAGKMYIGWKMVREKHAELRAKYPNYNADRPQPQRGPPQHQRNRYGGGGGWGGRGGGVGNSRGFKRQYGHY